MAQWIKGMKKSTITCATYTISGCDRFCCTTSAKCIGHGIFPRLGSQAAWATNIAFSKRAHVLAGVSV